MVHDNTVWSYVQSSQQPSAVSVGDLLKILVESQQRQAEAEERQRVAEEETSKTPGGATATGGE